MTRIPVTVRGAQSLREELEHLKNGERPRIIRAIAEARAHGDLKENAEYHAAREQQSFTEGRISQIEHRLSHCQIIDVTQLENNGRVVFGATVHLINGETQEEVVYQIVGEDEANIKASKVSVTSPIARALISKEVGDVVSVSTPSGELAYEISHVEYI